MLSASLLEPCWYRHTSPQYDKTREPFSSPWLLSFKWNLKCGDTPPSLTTCLLAECLFIVIQLFHLELVQLVKAGIVCWNIDDLMSLVLKKLVGKKAIIWLTLSDHGPSWRETGAGSPGTNLEAETKAETVEEYCLFFSLLRLTQWTCFLTQSNITCPEVVPPTLDQGQPQSSLVKKVPRRLVWRP